MVVSIVLDTEYMGVAERKKWFLKNVSEALDTNMLIITHEYMRNHICEIIESCDGRFYDEFEMKKVSVESLSCLDICYLPDSIFDRIYEKQDTRSRMLLEMYNKGNQCIERLIIQAIDNKLRKEGEQAPTCIFNCLHVFEFVRNVARHYECPIVPYVFSAIRKVHGYTQTLYMAHLDDNLFHSNEARKMYALWNKNEIGFKPFSKRELLALLGKKHNFVLFPLMEAPPKYEVGVVGEGYHVTPELYQHYPVTDDDIFYECKRYYNGSIVCRIHPMQLDQIGIGRQHMKNDPAEFILSGKRIMTVQSQMIVKAMLWNRKVSIKGDALPYSFLANSNIANASVVEDIDLNFLLFGYFVPGKCMFNEKYWLWRKQKPDVNSIIMKHINVILNENSMQDEVLFYDNEKRLRYILNKRGVCDFDINRILHKSVDEIEYRFLSSKLRIKYKSGDFNEVYCLNRKDAEGNYVSEFIVNEGIISCEFCPQNDIDGLLKIKKVIINGNIRDVDEFEKYYPKNVYVYACSLCDITNLSGTNSIVFKWNGKYFGD